MNTEVLPICIEHIHTAHSCLSFLFFLIIMNSSEKAISAFELFREETDYVIMEKTGFYQLIWQIQAQTLYSSLVSHLDYCDILLNLL